MKYLVDDIANVDVTPEGLMEYLNKRGTEGWTLVDMMTYGQKAFAIFTRPRTLNE